MTIQQQVARNIIRLRKKKQMSQEALALESFLSPAYLRRIEHGTANPTIKALQRIANTLNVTVNQMIFDQFE